MITSYMAIHHDEEDHVQGPYERSRADRIIQVANRHGVNTREKPDGDTTYIEAYVSVISPRTTADGGLEIIDDHNDGPWGSYVEFLMDVEDSNLGYLLHEVDTEAEMRLLETLIDIADNSPSLALVDVDYRSGVGHRNR